MIFIGFVIFLFLLYGLFNSNDKLGDIDKSKKILNNFSSNLEEKIRKNESKTSIINKDISSNTINIPTDLLKNLRENKKNINQKIEEFGLAMEVDGTINFDIDLNSLVFDEKIINFILIRYYLTGLKSFPDFVGFKDYLIKSYGNLSEKSFLQLWNRNLERINFDEKKVKNIDGLYHFTHKENLQTILKSGLITRSNLNKNNHEYRFNDEQRWDGVEDSISLSISHPNQKMFYKYRSKTNDNDWVVLKISNDLLTGSKTRSISDFDNAIFCKTNAASFKEKNRSIIERKTYKALLEMFESPIGKDLQKYTVDNQAEILYQGNIPIEFIDEIYVLNQPESLNWVLNKGFKVSINKKLFEMR